MGGEVLYVHMPTLWSLCSTKGIYQTTETSSGLPSAGEMSSDNIPGQSTVLTPGQGQLRHMVQLISQLFEGLGLMVNHKKSILLPAQNLGFLGFNINSQTMQISLPQEKMRKTQHDSSRLLAQQSVSVCQIARFVGKTTDTL